VFTVLTLWAVLVCPEPTPAPSPLALGEKLLARQQYAAAERELRSALEVDPSSGRAHGDLALALMFQKKTREAVDEGRLSAAFAPESAEARYIYGLTLSAAGKPVDAAREYEKAVALRPDQVRPVASLAQAYAAAEDGRTAATYEKAIGLAPSDPKLRAELAEYLWGTGRSDDGNAVMCRALLAFPSDADLAVRYGRSLAEQDRLADAERVLEKAQELGATDAATLAILARVDVQQGRMDEARAVLEAGVAAYPTDAFFRHELGRVWLGQGKAEEAFPHLESAAAASPDHAEYQLDLGRALEALGRLEEAEAGYRKATRAAPNSLGAHFALGRLLQREGKKEEAESELAKHHDLYERARQQTAQANVQASELARAWVELEHGKAAEALARFQKFPESAESLRGEALAYQRLGRHTNAVRALERARALAPDDAHLQMLLVAERSRAASTP
jgi:Flp pilus assembly protein TadD